VVPNYIDTCLGVPSSDERDRWHIKERIMVEAVLRADLICTSIKSDSWFFLGARMEF